MKYPKQKNKEVKGLANTKIISEDNWSGLPSTSVCVHKPEVPLER